MTLKQLTLAAGLIASLGIGTGAVAWLTQPARAGNPQAPAAAASSKQADRQVSAKPPDEDRLLANAISSARQLLDVHKAYYTEGRITVDRYIAASKGLQRLELLAARDRDAIQAIRRRHLQFLKDLGKDENAKLVAGRSTIADVAEINQAYWEAEYETAAAGREDSEVARLRRRVSELERTVEQLQKQRGGPGRP